MEAEVEVAGFPCRDIVVGMEAYLVRSDGLDPFFCRRARDEDRLSGLQTVPFPEGNADRAYRKVVTGDLTRLPEIFRALASYLDERVSADAAAPDDGLRPLSSEHHSASGHVEAAFDIVGAVREQDHSLEAVRSGGEGGGEVKRPLEHRGGVSGRSGQPDDRDGRAREKVGQSFVPGFISAEGIVRDTVPVGIGDYGDGAVLDSERVGLLRRQRQGDQAHEQ